MSQQLVKKGANGRYSNVMPKSWIEAIKDKNTGKTLVEILQSFNMYFLSYDGNSTSTRCLVPTMLRKKGLWITYVKYDGNVYTEWYAANEIDDKSWGDSSNWRIGNNTLVGDITISSNGNWVINGTETEFKAVGEKGNTPLVRFGSNNKFQVSYNNGDKWIDISDSITNNLRIKKYIGTNESLPTSGIEEGTIYMKGPYYAEDDTLNDNPIYRMWVYAWKGNTLAWQDNGEFISVAVGVVQETGDSETEVMSQKAVTRELSELDSEINDLDDSLYLIGRKLYGDVSKSYNFTSGDSYAETLFESPIRKGDTIKSISFSTAVVAYFIKKDGTITNAIDVSSYPQELTEEYIGIKTSSKTNVLILVNYDAVGVLEKVKTSEDKIETLETDYSDLSLIVNGKGIEVIEVKAEGSYNEFLFPMPIIEQSIIKSISLPNTINAYLTRSDGTYDINTPVNSLSFPYTVTENYRGIKVAKESTFNIVVDYNRIGLKEYTDNQVAKIEKDIIGTSILYNTEKGFINTTGYDTEVVFDKIIPVGSIITKVNNSVGVIWWLTNSNGSASLNLSELQLPYTTTSEYRGIRASSSGNYSIEYTEGEKTEGKVRQTIKVLTSDSDVQVFEKMLSAYRQGSVDVFFEKGIYELKEVYTTIREVLNTTWTVGLPIGNDCRYYFNGSTLISNQPSDGFNQSRNVLDCQAQGSNYELYDAILINNGGRYCVHDEGNKSDNPYIHSYNNIKMIYNTTDATPDSGCKPYGAGLGYDSELNFNSCQFIHNGDDGTPFAIHGVVGATKQQSFKLNMVNCYINKHSLYVNEINKDKDIIEYYLVGNLWGSDFNDSNYTKLLKWNNVVI